MTIDQAIQKTETDKLLRTANMHLIDHRQFIDENHINTIEQLDNIILKIDELKRKLFFIKNQIENSEVE